MGEENAFAVIAQKKYVHFLWKMVVIHTKPKLIVSKETKETQDIFDFAKKRIASVRLEGGVLKVTPKGNVLVSFSGFEKVPAETIGGNGKKIRVFGTIETENDVIITSGNGKQTIISQSLEAIASCYPF